MSQGVNALAASAAELSTALPPLHTLTRTEQREVVEKVAAELAATAVARDKQGGTALLQRQLLRDSGLLTLAVPQEFGGQGWSWPDIYPVIRRLTEADSSLGHLFAFQHLQVASVLLYGSAEQKRELLTQTVQKKWFWGNATNGRDPRLSLRRDGVSFVLDGVKSFCSGAADADAFVLTAPVPSKAGGPVDDRLFLWLPGDRQGLRVDTDWDAIGQRQTDSVSVHFDNVKVAASEILGGLPSDNLLARRRTPWQTLRSTVSQLILTEIYIGNAQAALAAARDYAIKKARPWPDSDADSVVADRYVQKHFGELWVALQGAIALADKAALSLQAAWEKGEALTAAERAEAALAVFTAKASATRAALEITSRIFEPIGAGATLSQYGHDRFWRNVRTHTLHDPVDYKFRDLGRWLLSGQSPTPGVYS